MDETRVASSHPYTLFPLEKKRGKVEARRINVLPRLQGWPRPQLSYSEAFKPTTYPLET